MSDSSSFLHHIHHTVCGSYEDVVYSEWVIAVDEVARCNLEKPLLVRDTESMHIAVNFDSEVSICPYVYGYLNHLRTICMSTVFESYVIVFIM